MSTDLARSFKHRLSAGLARLARRPHLTPTELRALCPERILIVRQHNQMGDMVCATPALRAIRETWPEAELALVTAPVNRGVVEFNPDLNRVINFDRKVWRRPDHLLGFVSELRGFKADLAFVLSSISFSVTSAWIAAASGAQHIIGSDSQPFGWDVSRHIFSLEMPAQPGMDCNAVAHNLAPLAAVGITTSDPFPVVAPAPGQVTAAGRIIADLNLDPGFWALHPGAGKRQNIWPAAHFADVARRALADGRQVLILHGPADAEPLAELKRLLGSELGGNLRVAPACPVGVGAALLQQADRFLCNDTGVMHMAGALRVPTVAMFGPTDPALWQPPAPEVVVVKSSRRSPVAAQGGLGGDEFGWMENIAPDDVWRAWSELTGQSLDNKKD